MIISLLEKRAVHKQLCNLSLAFIRPVDCLDYQLLNTKTPFAAHFLPERKKINMIIH